jgi:hypothetical protein
VPLYEMVPLNSTPLPTKALRSSVPSVSDCTLTVLFVLSPHRDSSYK